MKISVRAGSPHISQHGHYHYLNGKVESAVKIARRIVKGLGQTKYI